MSYLENNHAAILYGVNDLRVQPYRVDLSRMRPTDVLVRVQAVGICGSDVHYLKKGIFFFSSSSFFLVVVVSFFSVGICEDGHTKDKDMRVEGMFLFVFVFRLLVFVVLMFTILRKVTCWYCCCCWFCCCCYCCCCCC